MNHAELIARLRHDKNLHHNEIDDLLNAAADALERPTAGDVRLPEPCVIAYVESPASQGGEYRHLVNSYEPDCAMHSPNQLQDYGARCAAAAVAPLLAEKAAILQAITYPGNQPSQFGTVTLEYHDAEVRAAVLAERERCAKWLDDEADKHEEVWNKYIASGVVGLVISCHAIPKAYAEIIRKGTS